MSVGNSVRFHRPSVCTRTARALKPNSDTNVYPLRVLLGRLCLSKGASMLKFRSISNSLAALMIWLFAPLALAEETPKPDASKMPHMSVDVKAKQIRVECQALNPQMPLEFFCCMTGTAEHEAVLRSEVRPQHLHLGLLM